jgi:hypothetical protein
MRKLLFVLFLCLPLSALASFEKEEEVLRKWLIDNPEIDERENIQVETQAGGWVSAHTRDDINWSDKVIGGITLWSGGPNPVPGALAAIGATVFTLGVWPVGILATAGLVHLAEKGVQKLDVRWQEAEHMTFTSQRNQDRYHAERLLLLIGGFRASHAPLGSEDSYNAYMLFNEWATWVGLPIEEEEETQTPKVIVDTLGLRINTEIHKYKPALPREPINF